VAAFLDVLNASEPRFSDDEFAMADNYYTILSNLTPETWIDNGHPLSHTSAFTVGREDDERDWKYSKSWKRQPHVAKD
jgi:hypothetical protein